MEFGLTHIPSRPVKPRSEGLTMVLDKGLSTREAEDFVEVNAGFCDLLKFGWGTSVFMPNLERKLAIYREAGIHPYFGGTLFEAYLVRNQINEYLRVLDAHKMTHVEISDGTAWISEELKLEMIYRLSKHFVVLSEVGSKDATKDISPYLWVKWIQAELQAGAWKVICEARETGTVGVFQNNGEVRSGLIDEILFQIDAKSLLFEAPKKEQQAWFVKKFGANVNVGNIAPFDVIPLETIRTGLRSDTFFAFLPDTAHQEIKIQNGDLVAAVK